MFKVKEKLEPQNNKLTSFFPINTKDRTGVFDWDVVLGHFIKHAYRKKLKVSDITEFKVKCKVAFEEKLDEKAFWAHLEAMYFSGDELYKISPELLLFKAHELKSSSANKRLGNLFQSLLQDFHLKDSAKLNLNFLEREIVQTFSTCIDDSKISEEKNVREASYLPFLSHKFTEDLSFLANKPSYFINSLVDFLKLYAFLYTAQLTLNLTEWRNGVPNAKPCYFILDNEKASDERTFVKSFGYRQLLNNFDKVFPYLAMNESLQQPGEVKQPLWKVAEFISGTGNTESLNSFADKFKEDRKLNTDIQNATNEVEALANLLKLSHAQFGRGESRSEVNVHFCRAIESELCNHFVQSRGRAGRVLVFNQDYILLLTNLAIGKRERLRLHELITEFESK